MKEIGEIKSNIYKIAAVTDRGQRLNKLISPMYEEKANEMDELIDNLKTLVLKYQKNYCLESGN